MIPGTSHRARRRRRAVARRRRLGQPAAVAAAVSRLGRHGADDRRHAPEQPVRARRLQRRLLERRQLPGVQLRDRRRLGRNGPGRHARQHGAEGRRQLVPRHRCSATTRRRRGRRTTADRRASASPARGTNLTGDTTFNKTNNFLTNVSQLTKNYDFNPGVGGPIVKDQVWFYGTFRYLGVNKTVVDSFYDADPVAVQVRRRTPAGPGIDDGHIRSIAGRVVGAGHAAKDKISYYHDEQDKVRGHWGIASTVPPEASAIQATPTSFVSVTKWTRTHTQQAAVRRRLRASTTRSIRRTTSLTCSPAPVPLVTIMRQQHRQDRQRLEQPGRSLLEAVHRAVRRELRHRRALAALRRHVISQAQLAARAAVHASTCSRSPTTPACRSRSTLRIPTDRKNSINERHRPLRAGQVDDQPRDDQRRPPLRPVHRRDAARNAAGRHVQPGGHLRGLRGRQEQPERRLHGPRAELEGHQPARRRRVRRVRQRQDRRSRRASRATSPAPASPPAASPTTTTRRRRSA